MKRKPVIAIDGHSSTGKSSISKIIAKQLGIVHLDTGALYRAITFYGLRHCAPGGIIDKDILLKELHNIKIDFRLIEEEIVVFLNNENISREIRLPEVSDQVSFVAMQPEVREYLLYIQKEMAKNGGIIMDGRDIGTVVLPDADYKFFITASVDERTKRRYKELLASGEKTDAESVRQNLLSRDKTDSERSVAPLQQADDAILIDNTYMDKNETVDFILSLVKRNSEIF